MAGATNRQYKAAGLPRASVDVLRVNGSAGMTRASASAVTGGPVEATEFV